MKYLKLFFITALSIFTICSCTDSNIVPEEPETPVTPDEPEEPETPEETGPDYLFMFYGVGGGSLDQSIISNIFQALDAGNDDNVKMTFQYKMSAKIQEKFTDFNGTRRFTGEDNEHLKGTLKSQPDVYPRVHETKYKELFAQLKSEKIGGADYDMVCADSLTSFIKWSKDKYPAKRTILVLAGHGRGWAMTDDSKDNAQTRSVLKDDNSNTFMTLNTVVNGVKNAGNVDLIYADACLMSMYEVLYGYAECTKYFMASMEATPEAGGEYINFINLLKQAGSTDEGFEEALRKHCDYCVNDWWPKGNYSDIGFYNLTKIGKLTEALKGVVDTMVEKYTSKESVEPTKEGPLGEQFSKYINNAFMKCETVDVVYLVKENFTSTIVERMKKDDVIFEPSTKQDVFHWLGAKYQARNDAENADLKDELEFLVAVYSRISENSFSLTDLLRNLDNSLVEVGARNNPFGALRTKLLSALKEMSYIKCVTPKAHTGIDEEYELCSPGIFIIPMTNNKIYSDAVYARVCDDIMHLDDALQSYQNTAFDQQIGWSRMLTLLDVMPSYLMNPVRSEVK